jgi:PHD/YefM family antitoxin component YafN of YafNO toxin-antitoxin module
MRTISAANMKSKLSQLLDEAEVSHEPIHISGRKSHGILISEQDWKAIQETLFLLSIPKMRESIRKGLKTPVDKCATELPWWRGSLFSQNKPKRTQKKFCQPG